MKTLYGKKYYRPREIAELRLITNSKDSPSVASNYAYILRLIKAGRLHAKDYSIGGTPYYMVKEDEIERFKKEFVK